MGRTASLCKRDAGEISGIKRTRFCEDCEERDNGRSNSAAAGGMHFVLGSCWSLCLQNVSHELEVHMELMLYPMESSIIGAIYFEINSRESLSDQDLEEI